MALLEGKKGIVTGVVNEYSFAYHILKQLLASQRDGTGPKD